MLSEGCYEIIPQRKELLRTYVTKTKQDAHNLRVNTALHQCFFGEQKFGTYLHSEESYAGQQVNSGLEVLEACPVGSWEVILQEKKKELLFDQTSTNYLCILVFKFFSLVFSQILYEIRPAKWCHDKVNLALKQCAINSCILVNL